jgi:hypothetical protein
MKKPVDVEDVTAKLKAASSAPLVQPSPQLVRLTEEKPPLAKKAAASKPVFLRVPGELYGQYEAEATKRTRATGKGVTVQQVMLEKLAGAL